MTREEIVDMFAIEEPVYFFEPEELFNKGILGVSEDNKHIIYGYYSLAAVLAEDFEKDWKKEDHKGEEKPDFWYDAFEWLDENVTQVAGTIESGEENYPIIIYELTYERRKRGTCFSRLKAFFRKWRS